MAQFCPKFYPAGIPTHIRHIHQISQNHRCTQVSGPTPLILVVKCASSTINLRKLDVLPVTIPQFPFPPGTVLYPNHTFVYQYHKSIISHWNLSSYIRLSHEVLAADWHGDRVSGHWQLSTLDHTNKRTAHARFDYLVVATGHNSFPNEPKFQGQQAWEASAPVRKILHSIFHREPDVYRGRNILVVGGGTSAGDIVQQVVGFANSVWTIYFLPSPQRVHFSLQLTNNLTSFHRPLDIRFYKE
jgi:cation diffusion facilitator CzcD-associated flavoprotein CzcO